MGELMSRYMATTDGAGKGRISSVVKALDIIEVLWKLDGARIVEITEETGYPKSTVHVYLSSLREKGFVVKKDREYRLGLRFLTYGEYTKRSEPLHEAAKEPIEDLAERTGERVWCSTYQNGLTIILCVAEGERSLDSDFRPGSQLYSHASAGGKAILAHLPEEEVDQMIERWGLPSFNENTTSTRSELFEELAEIRERGVSINDGEYRQGIHSIGAPVLKPDSGIYGSISLIGPNRRLKSEWDMDELYDKILATSNTIEVNLGF